jgi:hypothetical protein
MRKVTPRRVRIFASWAPLIMPHHFIQLGGGYSLLLVFTNVGLILHYYSELHPSGLFRSETDVSGHPIGSIFKGQGSLDDATYRLSRYVSKELPLLAA